MSLPDKNENENNPEVWKNFGNDFFNKRQYDEAIRCYFKAIELNHDYLDAWNNLGYVYFKLGKIEEAVKCNKKVKEIKSKLTKLEETQIVPKKKKFTMPAFSLIGILVIAVIIVAVLTSLMLGVFSGGETTRDQLISTTTYPTSAVPTTIVHTELPTVVHTEPPTTIKTPLPTEAPFFQTKDDEILWDSIVPHMTDIEFYVNALADFWEDDDYIGIRTACQQGSKSCVKAMEETGGLRTSQKFNAMKSEHFAYLNNYKVFFQKYEEAAIAYRDGQYSMGRAFTSEAEEAGDRAHINHENIMKMIDSM